MADRIASFEVFYPWYLGEHRVPACRWLHFGGTSGFVGTVLACLAARPLPVLAALIFVLGSGYLAFGMESRRSAAPVLLAMIAVAGCIALIATAAAGADRDPRPNIVFMLADDQGWNGLSVAMHPDVPASKGELVQTPRLEQLAAAGMRFSNAYAPAPVCSPTQIGRAHV